MKTPRHYRPSRSARESRDNAKEACQQALKLCELAAARLEAAGEELAASWTALCREIGTGVSSTDLLRKRAWCNVLELRLKEQAQALEQARHGLDAVWEDLMLSTRARELFNRFLKSSPGGNGAESQNLPLLARTASAIAAAHRRAAPAKK
jgi:hypothetical protein